MAFTKSISIIASLLFCVCCAVQKTVTIDLPPEMLPHVKPHYESECARGQVLYDLNCGKCHTTYVKRKKIVPDFTEDQLRGYELRLTNKKHQAELTDSVVSEEELSVIMTFLRYKTRNKPSK
jgi:hypothetical protein